MLFLYDFEYYPIIDLNSICLNAHEKASPPHGPSLRTAAAAHPNGLIPPIEVTH